MLDLPWLGFGRLLFVMKVLYMDRLLFMMETLYMEIASRIVTGSIRLKSRSKLMLGLGLVRGEESEFHSGLGLRGQWPSPACRVERSVALACL